MRVFYIVLEIIWVLLGIACIYLGVRTAHAPGHTSTIFYVMAVIAFGMAIYRHLSRRARERKAHR